MARPLDIVVFGATGFTGRLVCEHLAKAPSARAYKWAVAGRNLTALGELTKTLRVTVPILCADATAPESLDALCTATVVVLACAGPFDQFGMPLVDACVRNRTSYVDITGEFQFVRKVIERHHEAARDAGLAIVPCCAFDSVPSDITNYALHHAAAAAGKTLTEVRGVWRTQGGFSGGTLASVAHMFTKGVLARCDRSPVSLNPADARAGIVAPVRVGIGYDADAKTYTCPFLMAATNERVVRRSNAMLGRACAVYTEASAGSLVGVLAQTGAYYGLAIALSLPLVARLLNRFVFPAQGTGPSAQQLAKGRFRVQFFAKAADGTTLRATFAESRDVYVSSGVFVAEAAMCAVDRAKAGATGRASGVLTPATAFGAELLLRLRASGTRIDIE